MSAVETEASLNQVLRRKDHALRKLIQKIVHDSNNYYSVFKGYISLLDISSLDKEVLGKYLPPMKDALKSGIRLDTRLTAYFHVVSPMRIELDLSALANEVCARQAAEHNFTVTVTTEGDCPPILVEEPSVRSLLANLCLLAEETATVDAVLLLDSQWMDAAQLAGMVLDSTPGVYLHLQLTIETTMFEQEDLTEFLNPYQISPNHDTDLGLGMLLPVLRNHGGNLDLAANGERLTLAIYFPLRQHE